MNKFNFKWLFTNQLNNSKNISLTINLDIDDNAFNDLVGFRKLTINDVAEKYEFDFFTEERIKKFEYLVREIKETKSNILVGNAGYDLNDLKIIGSLLKKEKLKIHTVFIRSEKRRNADLLEGQELYRNHNRWIDFYPGQIEDVHQEKENNLKEIKDYFEGTETLIVEI